MAKFFDGSVKIDISSMTTEELIKYRNNLQLIVDQLTHDIRIRKMCEHKHKN